MAKSSKSKSFKVEVKPEFLIWGRKRAEKTLEELSKQFPILKSCEEGKNQMTLDELQEFAKAVHLPIGYLFLSKIPEEKLPFPDLRRKSCYDSGKFSISLLDTCYDLQNKQDWFEEYKTREKMADKLEIFKKVPKTSSKIQKFISERFAISGPRNQALTELTDLMVEEGITIVAETQVREENLDLQAEEFSGIVLNNPVTPFIFLNLNSKDPLRTAIQALYYLFSGKDGILGDNNEETEELENRMIENLAKSDSATKTEKIRNISYIFVRSVGYDTLGGNTLFQDGYKLLNVVRWKHDNFIKILEREGVRVPE